MKISSCFSCCVLALGGVRRAGNKPAGAVKTWAEGGARVRGG